jgi:hypothetical protein
MENRVTVRFYHNGEYGEVVAKSKTSTCQEMVDSMHRTANKGIKLKFLGEYGILVPTGYKGDPKEYISY